LFRLTAVDTERALRHSILQLRTQVRACRLSLAKHTRLCDIAPDSGVAGIGAFCRASGTTGKVVFVPPDGG